MNSLASIRAKCLDCSGWSQKSVETCEHTDCTLHPFRFGKRPATAAKRGKVVADQTMTPSRAIRRNCLWCTKDQPVEIRECPSTQCPVWGWRFGKPPVKSPGRVRAGELLANRNAHLCEKNAVLAAVPAPVGVGAGVSLFPDLAP